MQRRWASVQDATKKDTQSWKRGSVNGGIRTPVGWQIVVPIPSVRICKFVNQLMRKISKDQDDYRNMKLPLWFISISFFDHDAVFIRCIFPALRRYLPLPSLRSRYFGRKGSLEGMSQTLREFSTRHCLISQFIVLGRLGVTPEFGTTAKETPALMVLCVRIDESGHAGKMRSFLTTFTKRQYHTSCKCCIGISELNPPTAITVQFSVQCYLSIPPTVKVYIMTNTQHQTGLITHRPYVPIRECCVTAG